MGTKNLQHRAPTPQKIEPRWRQKGAKRAPKSKNNIDPTKKRVVLELPPYFVQKSGQHGSKLGPKLELKWIRNPSKNRSKK